MKEKILIVEDNKKLAGLFKEALSDRFDADVAHTLGQAYGKLSDDYRGFLLDLQLPDGEGTGLIPAIKRQVPDAVIIVVTAYGTVQKAVDALKLGATDFLEKPVDLEALLQRFADLVPSARAGAEPVAVSPGMRQVLELASRVAPTPFPVLITGETGTGKDVIARFIHEKSGRPKLITLNCASLPEQLADSILFGHTKGSFTGAVERKKGLVEAADGGTLFLDEIGELPLSLQAKFLRFLDTGTFMPIGSTEEKRCDVRVIAATNRDLEAEVKAGTFRQDLYFRLASFPITIPPLRQRREDIIPLAELHLKKLESVLGGGLSLTREAERMLMEHPFPGNVRELFNILDRASVMAAADPERPGTITRKILAPLLSNTPSMSAAVLSGGAGAGSPSQGGGDIQDLWSATRASAMEKERELIKRALEENNYNKAAAARALKVSYKTLLNKMKRLGL